MFKLFERDATVAIFVKLLEDLLQVIDLVGVGLYGNSHECDLLQFLGFLELFHIVYVQLPDHLFVLRFFSKVSDPLMFQHLFCRQSFLWLADEFLDEVFCIIRDIVPFLTIEVEFTFLDHLEDLLIVIAVKGWVSTKEDVKHAASRPHVASDIVVALEHLRRNVVWSSCSGLHSLKTLA